MKPRTAVYCLVTLPPISLAVFWAATDISSLFLLCVWLLAVSALLSFQFLAAHDKLLNAIQSLLLQFYVWICLGPTAILLYESFALGRSVRLSSDDYAMSMLWFSAGLPLYALGAQAALSIFSGQLLVKLALVANEALFTRIMAIRLLVVTLIAENASRAAQYWGLAEKSAVGYLGGAQYNTWWLGVLDTIAGCEPIAVAIFAYIVMTQKRTKLVRLVLVLVISNSLVSALTSGSKGPILYAFTMVAVAYMSHRQLTPWKSTIVLVLAYFLIVEPFVTLGRHLASMQGVQTVDERKELFTSLATSEEFWRKESEVNIGSPFRGVALLASSILSRTRPFAGLNGTDTILWGLRANIPRQLDPDKPNLSIGNFYARTLGAEIGITSAEDTVVSIAPSLPMDIVANFGWLSGLVGMPLIGAAWAIINVGILSRRHLADHPMSPYMVMCVMWFEGPFGHWLGNLRGLVISLAIVLGVAYYTKRSIGSTAQPVA